MRLFGYEILKAIRVDELTVKAQTLESIGHSSGGWFPLVGEPWGGAFQQNVAIDASRDILAFSAVFACVTAIAQDIAKLRVRLMEEAMNGIGREVEESPFLAFFRRPNHYQTWQKFIEQWIVSKLLYGNAYVLKEREPQRRLVSSAYVLNPRRVKPLVTEGGDVYYELDPDNLSRVAEKVIVPAREMFHDSMVCLFHPLVGVSPIYAAGISATQGRRIQSNSTTFFDNMSRPSGVLTAPGKIDDETAARLKKQFEENFSGKNVGRTMVGGMGLKYEAMTIPAEQAQLIEQLRWTVEDVARTFHVPLYKVGGPVPAGSSIDALNQAYYSDCLQALLESAEAVLDFGLELPTKRYTEFDLSGLLRMDQMAQITMLAEGVKSGIRAPDEARARLNLPPVPGGKYPYLQQQNFSLEALAKRDAQEDPFGMKPKPEPVAPPAANDDEVEEEAEEIAAALTDLIIRDLEADLVQA
jgi:HK97 family phage portal protein